MSLQVAPIKLGDWLHEERKLNASRANVTVLSGENLKCGTVVQKDSAGKYKKIAGVVNEVHTVTITGTLTAGTVRFTFWHKDGYFVQTADIAYNADATALQTAINAVLGTSAVAVSGTMASFTVTFSGTGYAALTQPVGIVDWSMLIGCTAASIARTTPAGTANEVQTVALAGTLSAGTFQLTLQDSDGVWKTTSELAYNASNTDIQTAINAALGASSVAVAGTVASFTVTFSGTDFAGKEQPPIQVEADGVTGLTGVTVTETTKGGGASRVAAGILVDDCDASAGDTTGVIIARDAMVNGDKLIYYGANPTVVAEALLALGIVVRSEPTIKVMTP